MLIGMKSSDNSSVFRLVFRFSYFINESEIKNSAILFSQLSMGLITYLNNKILLNKEDTNRQVSTLFSRTCLCFFRVFTSQGPLTLGFKKELSPKADPVRNVLWLIGTTCHFAGLCLSGSQNAVLGAVPNPVWRAFERWKNAQNTRVAGKVENFFMYILLLSFEKSPCRKMFPLLVFVMSCLS